jgi:hypothetical protein
MLLVDGCRADEPHGRLRGRDAVTVERGERTLVAIDDDVGGAVRGRRCSTPRSMANSYNGNRRIPVVFVADGLTRLAVRREARADLLARDVD